MIRQKEDISLKKKKKDIEQSGGRDFAVSLIISAKIRWRVYFKRENLLNGTGMLPQAVGGPSVLLSSPA